MAEQRDIKLRPIIIFGAGMVIAVAVSMLVTGWLTNFWRDERLAKEAPPSPVTIGSHLPPEPRLQVNAPLDLQHWRAQEDSILTNYDWVDRNNGIVRIPIDRAMELIARRGVPK
jgi:hypothetical protein